MQKTDSYESVPGNRENRYFMPLQQTRREMVRDQDHTVITSVSALSVNQCSNCKYSQLASGQYVICIYEGKWFVGLIALLDNEQVDYMIAIIHPPLERASLNLKYQAVPVKREAKCNGKCITTVLEIRPAC